MPSVTGRRMVGDRENREQRPRRGTRSAGRRGALITGLITTLVTNAAGDIDEQTRAGDDHTRTVDDSANREPARAERARVDFWFDPACQSPG